MECAAKFTACLLEVYGTNLTTPATTTSPAFDKDDPLAMRLVTAAFNLRSHVFGIDPLQSLYATKGIAGNIIPAISTTNAIVTGLQVLHVFRILAQLEKNSSPAPQPPEMTTPSLLDVSTCCNYVYCIRNHTRKGFYLQPTALPPPNPWCFVCRKGAVVLTKILKRRLGCVEPTLTNAGGDIIHEEGLDADTEIYAVNLDKLLTDLPGGGLRGAVLSVDDFGQDLEVDLCVTQREEWDEKTEPDGFLVSGHVAAVQKREAKSTEEVDPAAPQAAGDNDDDIIEVMDKEV